MFEKAKPVFLIAETPLHVGSGSDLGVIDLPIQRERYTNLPKIEASSVKGAIRATFPDAKIRDSLFGPEEGDLYAGALGFKDGRILLFPVKSMKGLFAWTTCHRVLHKFKDEMEKCGIQGLPEIPEGVTVTQTTDLVVKDSKIILEEFAFATKTDANCTEWAKWLSENVFKSHPDWWKDKIKNSLVILDDDSFRDFVTYSTEVITRTNIDPNTGTVKEGALFSEEFLPTDSVMYFLLLGIRIFKPTEGMETLDEALDTFFNNLNDVIQIGGDSTLGKGLCRVIH